MSPKQRSQERHRLLVYQNELVEEDEAHGPAVRGLRAVAKGPGQARRAKGVIPDFPQRGAEERPWPLLGHDEEDTGGERGRSFRRRHVTQWGAGEGVRKPGAETTGMKGLQMHRRTRALPAILLLLALCAHSGHSQTLSVAVAAGPVFLPGSGSHPDWEGLVALGIEKGDFGARLEGMYAGVPGADLVALTGNLVWIVRRERLGEVEPYVIVGVGSYVKFSESRFGVNGGLGVRRRAGPLWVFGEARYHRVTRRFEEARSAATFIPVSVGVALGN